MYQRFKRWRLAGVFTRLFADLPRDHPLDEIPGVGAAAVTDRHGMEPPRRGDDRTTGRIAGAEERCHGAGVERGAVAAHTWGTGANPQVPINDKKMYPLYAKCVELDIPIFVNAGIPGPRVPFACQDVAHIDEVCWFFPDLKFVMRHGAEPWEDLAVKLMLKWPNLYYSTSAFAPKHYPEAIVDYANTRGADKILYAGYYAAGLSLDRIFAELPGVPFRDHVWPKFLHGNARKVFQLDD